MTHFSFVHSYRGGAGKTTTVANLAYLMASRGQRVGVVDTNLQAPGLHCFFGLDLITGAPRTLNHFLRREVSIEEAVYDVTAKLGLPTDGEAGGGRVFAVPASEELSQMAYFWKHDVDTDLMLEGLVKMASDFELDILLVDTDPGLDHQTFFALERADSLLLIMTPDAQDYRGTATAVEVARRLEIPNILVMVNKGPAASETEAIKTRVQSLCGGASVVMAATHEGVSGLASESIFAAGHPEDPFTLALGDLADSILAIPTRTSAERFQAIGKLPGGFLVPSVINEGSAEQLELLSQQMNELQSLVQSAIGSPGAAAKKPGRTPRRKQGAA